MARLYTKVKSDGGMPVAVWSGPTQIIDMQRLQASQLVACLALVLAGCASLPSAEQRSAELRATFPPGKMTRDEVGTRLGHAPEVSLTRPSIGWSHPFILDVEQRTGALVARADKYIGPAVTSTWFTLEHVWYFYDRADLLVDVYWERMGD